MNYTMMHGLTNLKITFFRLRKTECGLDSRIYGICRCTGKSVQRASEVGKPIGRCGRSLNCDVTLYKIKVRYSAVRELVMEW